MERYLTMLWVWLIVIYYYSARNARIASAVLATAIPSVRPSVCLSVRHTPVLCQNGDTWHGATAPLDSKMCLVL